LNQALKQRLVGILVLGCLAVIVIPLLLDGEGVSAPAIEATIPPAPSLTYRELPLPERPLIDADSLPEPADEFVAATVDAEEDSPAADDSSTAAAAAAASSAIPVPVPADRSSATAGSTDSTPRRDAAGLPEALALRLGVFGSTANADALRACLIAEGFQAYARAQDNNLTGIYVGPVATRAEAGTLAGRIKGKCGLNGDALVMRYTP
jgi:cell division septation protein DedD